MKEIRVSRKWLCMDGDDGQSLEHKAILREAVDILERLVTFLRNSE